MKTLRVLACMFGFISLAPLLCADIVILKDGRRFEGKVIDKGKTIELRMGTMKTVFDKDRIARIEKKKSSAEAAQTRAGANIEFFGVKGVQGMPGARGTCSQDKVKMIFIPSGEVPVCDNKGKLIGKVSVKALLIDQTEVTNAQYALFLDHVTARGDGGYAHPTQPHNKDHTPKHWDDPRFNEPNQPVVGVDWYDAYAFARWAGKRLPTREEWRLAAGSKQAYPWGNEAVLRKCNHGAVRMLDNGERKLYTDSGDGFGYAAPAASFVSDQSTFGCFDMAGNVSEWTATRDEGKACRCGGNMCQPIDACRNDTCRFMNPTLRSFTTGFRCARDANGQ